MSEIQRFLNDYEAWAADRASISEQESEGDTSPDPDDWASSDDQAVELLRGAVELLKQQEGQLAITFAGEAYETFVEALRWPCEKHYVVTLTFADGTTKVAELDGDGYPDPVAAEFGWREYDEEAGEAVGPLWSATPLVDRDPGDWVVNRVHIH